MIAGHLYKYIQIEPTRLTSLGEAHSVIQCDSPIRQETGAELIASVRQIATFKYGKNMLWTGNNESQVSKW